MGQPTLEGAVCAGRPNLCWRQRAARQRLFFGGGGSGGTDRCGDSHAPVNTGTGDRGGGEVAGRFRAAERTNLRDREQCNRARYGPKPRHVFSADFGTEFFSLWYQARRNDVPEIVFQPTMHQPLEPPMQRRCPRRPNPYLPTPEAARILPAKGPGLTCLLLGSRRNHIPLLSQLQHGSSRH